MTKSSHAAADNRANQMNPNNPAYESSRYGSGDSKAATDNRANQLNPNNEETKSSPALPAAADMESESGE